MDQQKIRDRASKVLEIAQEMAEKLDRKHGSYSASNAIEEIRLHFNGFAEPGYQDDGEIVALGNWNSFRIWDKATNSYLKEECDLRGRLEKIFETLGVKVEWSESWDNCSDCYALIRTQADCYGWLPAYMTVNGERVCRNCVAKHPESYLSDLEDNPDNALTLSNVDPCDHGYKKLDEVYETGFHPGQNDDPKAVAKKLRDLGISRFLFQITGAGQFDMNWVVYVHEDEVSLLPSNEEDEDDEECCDHCSC